MKPSELLSEKLLSNLNEGVIKAWLNSMIPEALGFFWSVVLALIVYWIGRKLINVLISAVNRGMSKKNVDIGVITFTKSLLTAVSYIVLILVILNLFGISTSSVAAAVATLGLTAGLSLQGSLSNFAGGVLILILKPFVVGDYIMEDTHNNEGTVTAISVFYTKLLTIDQKVIVIPNGTLSNTSITNYTKNPTRRLSLTFSISYSDDIKRAKEVLTEVAKAEERRIPDSEILVFVDKLGESSVDIGLRFYIKADDYWTVRWDTLERAKYALEEAGCTIPFNQMDVHING